MSTPDIRVRLSPEGINEVIHALRQVAQESGRATRAAAGGTNILSGAIRDLKSLLPAIGLAAVVTGMVAMTRQALKTADATGKLQQRVGGTVEEISGLTFAFRSNESDQAALQCTLARTASVMQDVANESGGARAALAAIGVDADALTKLTTPRALEEIAKKLSALPPGAQRAAAASRIFGEQLARELTPALVALGREGIDGFIAKASAAGELIDERLVDATTRLNAALKDIGRAAAGVATQFAAGLAPQVAAAMTDFNRSIETDGLSAMRVFGEFVGKVIRGIVAGFTALGRVTGAVFASIGAGVSATAEAIGKAFTGDFGGAAEAIRRGQAQVAAIGAELREDLANLRKQLAAPLPPPQPREEGGGGVTPDPSVIRERAQARLALAKSRAEAELALQREAIRRQQEVDQQAFDQGLISLAEFFARRRALIERERDLEVTALRLEQQALAASATGAGAPEKESERIRLRQQLAELDAKIAQAQAEASRELLAIDGELTKAQRDLTREREDATIRLFELEGVRHEAFKANLALEIEEIRRLGQRAGETAAQIEAHVARFAAARTSAFNFDEASRKGQEALAAFDRDAEAIRRDQQAGIVSQLEGELQLLELQQKRLPVLQALAAAAVEAANATGSADAIARAQQFSASVDQIAASFNAATDFGQQFRTGAVEAFQSGIQTLLENAAEIDSLSDAFKSLARAVLDSLNQIAAEIIAKQATFALLRAFGISFGSSPAPAPGAKLGGFIRGYRGGGDIRAPEIPSLPGPDKVPILAQRGEFMLRRARVQEPGALDFLRAWNAGAFSLAQAIRFPRFATGGEIGGVSRAASGAAGGGVDRLRIVNVIGEQAVTDAMASASGERVLLNFIQRNSTAIRRVLGS